MTSGWVTQVLEVTNGEGGDRGGDDGGLKQAMGAIFFFQVIHYSFSPFSWRRSGKLDMQREEKQKGSKKNRGRTEKKWE